MKNKGELSTREKRFCSFYVSSGDFREAASLAGYPDPLKNGAALLSKESINRELERLYNARTENCRNLARAGYERLAFGNVTDAVKLMFAQEPDEEQLKSLDLFNIAEIRRPKHGALEIKFFDRIKALEKLEATQHEDKSRVSEFYSALVSGIREEQVE